MKTPDSFAYMIDNIFGELEEVSHVEIDSTPADPDETGQNENRLKITAVNGFKTAYTYLNFMRTQREKVMEKLKETMCEVAPEYTETFIDMVLRRIRIMVHCINIPDWTKLKETPPDQFFWNPRHVTCRHMGKITRQHRIIEESIALSQRYTLIFLLVMKRLKSRIKRYSGVSVNVPDSSEGKPKTHAYRFRINCTEEFMAMLVRLLYDRNILDNPVVSELCRQMTDTCYTSRKLQLSPGAFRKYFDNPTPEIIEKLLAEMRIATKYLEKLIERQRR
ncbi:MAG: hypothetical protein WCR01_14360 [Bacteroidota bacterium]